MKNVTADIHHIDGLSEEIDESKTKGTFVIGAGFGRTGTSSLQLALSKSGWRSYHMREIFKAGSKHMNYMKEVGTLKCKLKQEMKDYDPSFSNYNKIALSKDAFDWNKVFNDPTTGKYNAAVDFPACAFYLDLIEFYKPNYKVILTVRDDEDKWYKSVDKTIHQIESLSDSVEFRFFNWVLGTDFMGMRYATFGGLIFDAKNSHYDFWNDEKMCKQKYKDWIEAVKKHVPKDKLLVFNVKDGYRPFCEFLGVDIPNEEFPHANDTKVMLQVVDKMRKILLIIRCVFIIIVSVVVYLLFKQYA
eukprot:325721_1